MFDRVVIGFGWSALAAVGFSCLKGFKTAWIFGSESRLLPPQFGLEKGPGVDLWKNLFQGLGLPLEWVEEASRESFSSSLFEYRHKQFMPMDWPGERMDAHLKSEFPEFWFIGSQGSLCFKKSLFEIEEAIRSEFISGRFSASLEMIKGLSVRSMEPLSGTEGIEVTLESGKKFQTLQLIYADRWSLLPSLLSKAKPMGQRYPFFKGRIWTATLQAHFLHRTAFRYPGVYCGILSRESGEKTERRLWGYFSSDGTQSIWSTCLTSSEVEDNRQITKRLKKMKNHLDKFFRGEVEGNWMQTVIQEQIRFEEECLHSDFIPLVQPIRLSGVPGLFLLTDGYGPARAFEIAKDFS